MPVQEGLFTMPGDTSEESELIGSKCKVCGEVFFPQQPMCANCCQPTTEEIRLSRKGKLYSYSAVRNKPPGDYRGTIPFCVGIVELPEGIRIPTLLTEDDISKLLVGMNVALVLEVLFVDDEGNEIIGFKFKPC